MTTADLSSILPAIGGFSGAAAIGALLGYGMKKLLKVLMIVLAALAAIVALPLGYLSYKGIITIDWNALYTLLQTTLSSAASFIAGLIQTVSIGIPVLGGFGMGFVVGFQKG
ncbi:MAG: FUN14 domain-containing protein [Candidatus Bathyarchaeia archaeon]|jgi:uncharacterized membrane protein (Fun14 family)